MLHADLPGYVYHKKIMFTHILLDISSVLASCFKVNLFHHHLSAGHNTACAEDVW
jgi:hypothetical protein